MNSSYWSASLYSVNSSLLLPKLLPFRRWAQAEDPTFAMWILHYERGGEHLKFRFRAQPALRDQISCRFEAEAANAWTYLRPRPDDDRNAAEELPPIDLEDQASGLRPDRRLVWTTYLFESTHVGGKPLSEAEGFEEVYRQCLEAATGRILDQLEANQTTGDLAWPPLNRRLGWAADLCLGAGKEIIEDLGSQRLFWFFFRDWLLRIIPYPAASRRHLVQEAKARPAVVKRLRSRVEIVSEAYAFEPWREALRALRDLCLTAVKVLHVDQLTDTGRHAYWWVMCRLLHNAINPLHLRLPNEAYLAQLLTEASAWHQQEGT